MFGRKKQPDYSVNDLTIYSEHIYKSRSKNYNPNYVYLSSVHKREDSDCVFRLKIDNNHQVNYPIRFDDSVNKRHFILPTQLQHILGLKTGSKLTVCVHPIHQYEKDNAHGVNLILHEIEGRPVVGRFDQAELERVIRKSLEGYLLYPGQYLTFELDRQKIEMEVQNLLLPEGFTERDTAVKFGLLSTQAFIATHHPELDSVQLEMAELRELYPDNLEIPLDFAALGIGGHKQLIRSIIQRVFYTRVMSDAELQAYGVEKHAKGILLYGPPGTGKTLIAKTIAELLPQNQYVEVNGPEVMSSYVGASQGNIGAIFEKAKQHPNKLFIFFFDELEVISQPRQGSGSTSAQVGNEMVSRLLTELDGAKSADNVVFIGATNRKDLIDPALLRSGRLDAHFYVGLPDLLGRVEILNIHTQHMTTLAQDVDLHVIAEMAKNYSGAELANVVKVARSYAMNANLDSNLLVLKMKEFQSNEDLSKVTQAHFLRALNEVQPDFGLDNGLQHVHDKFACYSNDLQILIDDFSEAVTDFLKRPGGAHLNYLLVGETGTGKTTLAEYLAVRAGFQHIQVVRASEFLLMNESDQRLYLQSVYNKTRESREDSLVILDGLEDLIEADAHHKQYNNKLCLIINALLKDDVKRQNKMVVIATCESSDFLMQIRLGSQFYVIKKLPLVTLNSDAKEECAQTLVVICSMLGLAIKNDIDCLDGLQIQIPIAKLIDKLYQYCADPLHKGVVCLQEFMLSLPRDFLVCKENAGMGECEVEMSRRAAGFFG